MVRLLLSALLMLAWSRTASAQELGLRFDPFPPAKGTSVEFPTADGGMVPAGTIVGLPLRTEETQGHLYTLSVDTQSFGRDKYQRFSFDAYIYTARSKGTFVHKYTVSEDPIGPFPDAISTVTFHITGQAGEDTGAIRLPVHSNDGSDNLTLALPATLKIGLSGPSSSDLGLNNKLDSLHVHLLESHVSSTSCNECWLSLSSKANLDVLAPQNGTSLILQLRPNTIKALGKSALMLNPTVAHDTLLISVASVSDQGGLPTQQEFRVPVRFAPPALYLVLAVLLGALVGGVLRPWLKDAPVQSPQQPPGRLWHVKEVGVSVLIAVVIWIVALVLFSYAETRVVIFGFSFDPSQVLPAGLISLLAAGGPPIIAKLKDAFGK